MYRISGLIVVLYILVVGSSCSNVKNLQYLQGSFDTAAIRNVPYAEPVIQKGDLLGINVFSDDAKATAAVTAQVTPSSNPMGTLSEPGTSTGTGNQPVQGFLVNQQGDIQIYKLGVIHVEGMTRKRLADTLAQLYVTKDYLKNPYVEIRYLNFRVTLIGEVTRPGTYTIPTERISAFEAIGLAGDITVYGRRNNVLVVREANGVRSFGYLDLSKPDVFLSPYYYLQQNDMLVVDVGKNKGAVNDQTTMRNITVAASVLSTIAIFLNIFTR